MATFDEFKTLIGSGKTVIIDFTATWCGPCQRIGPKFEEFAKKFGSDNVPALHASCSSRARAHTQTLGQVVFVKVDVDENDEAASHCGVSAMPTFKVMKDGKQIDESVGASEEKLLSMIEKHVGGAKVGDLDF